MHLIIKHISISLAYCLLLQTPALAQQKQLPTGNKEQQKEAPSDFKKASSGESIAQARVAVQRLVDQIDTIQCELEMSTKPEGKRSRKTKVGPMELRRGAGARLKLTRKSSTDEYVANAETIWKYDHKDKEAKYFPTSLPVINFFVGEAMKLNVFLSVDDDTLKYMGTETVEGEECWVFQGKSPRRLKMVGVPVSDVRVWVAKKDGVPRKITLPNEEDTILRLRNVKINEPVSSKRFSFSPPKGVKTKNIFGF